MAISVASELGSQQTPHENRAEVYLYFCDKNKTKQDKGRAWPNLLKTTQLKMPYTSCATEEVTWFCQTSVTSLSTELATPKRIVQTGSRGIQGGWDVSLVERDVFSLEKARRGFSCPSAEERRSLQRRQSNAHVYILEYSFQHMRDIH
jgi:hypothetical protein